MYRFKTRYKVGDAMTMNPVVISPKKSLRDAAKLMAKEHVGALLVQDKDDIVGIITEQDLVRFGLAKPGNPATRKIESIMVTELLTVEPDEDIFEAIRMMRDENIRHLPVLNKGRFVGLVTMKDVLRIEPDLYEILVESIELREIDRKPVK